MASLGHIVRLCSNTPQLPSPKDPKYRKALLTSHWPLELKQHSRQTHPHLHLLGARFLRTMGRRRVWFRRERCMWDMSISQEMAGLPPFSLPLLLPCLPSSPSLPTIYLILFILLFTINRSHNIRNVYKSKHDQANTMNH